MSHTPGPWEVISRADKPQVQMIGRPSADPDEEWVEIVNENGVTTEADAELIAQAWTVPQLRAALEAIVDADDKALAEYRTMGFGEPSDEMKALTEQARAALALANEPADGDQS